MNNTGPHAIHHSQTDEKAAMTSRTVDRPRLPAWLKRTVPTPGKQQRVTRICAENNLPTVCVEAGCPNRAECFGRGTATFLIMGHVCSRNCRFCGVSQGVPVELDSNEPQRVVDTVKHLGLSYVVITSVTRDDLPDGGAGHFAAVVLALRNQLPHVTIELLIPDFGGRRSSVETVVRACPNVVNHNIETVPRLYPVVRPQAHYARSLSVCKTAASLDTSLTIKSGLMVGLGETRDEVLRILDDCREAGCMVLTIGQYLQPSSHQIPVVEFISPETFDFYTEEGKKRGFDEVVAGPFVRSSYHADSVFISRGSHKANQ